jgi:sugar lactone lactonase YvrE
VIATIASGPFELAEGPLWDSRTESLIWVDIAGGIVSRYELASGLTTQLAVSEQVGCVALTREADVVVAAMRSGWYWLELVTGRRRLIAAPERDRPRCRFNDGGVDPAGRFWTGSLHDDEVDPIGRLYRLDADLSVSTMDTNLVCSNGIDWSPDADWLYFVDSRRDVIYRYRYDRATGAIGKRAPFIDTASFVGLPDGITVDSSGNIWCAFWDGASIRAFDPDGRLLETIPVPALRPTSVAFGGVSMQTLYVTTATIGLSESQKRDWPRSGSVLALDSSYKGRPARVFDGVR